MRNNQGTIVLITNIPTPYRIPLFNEIEKQLRSEGMSLKVVFGAAGYERRLWDVDMSDCLFDYEILKSKEIVSEDFEKVSFSYTGLLGIINREQPKAIITNGFSPATQKIWLRSILQNTPFIIWSGAVGRKPVSLLRNLQRRILVRRASAFVAYGTEAREYLVSLGSDHADVSIGINTVDTGFFREETKRLREEFTKENWPKRLLYVGHLTRRKRADQLLDIVAALMIRRKDFTLVIVGDGPERSTLENMADELNIVDLVTFEGFKQKEELPRYFAAGDCFLFPSEYDIWGQVLVEAMAAGLPSLASIHAGATTDLIKDGVTGFAVDFSDPETVADLIQDLFSDNRKASIVGQKASQVIKEKASLEVSANGFIKAIHKVIA